jgi:hypothetical protein
MMPSGHKVFLVQNPKDVELLLMHNRTYAAEYVAPLLLSSLSFARYDKHSQPHNAGNILMTQHNSQITLFSF